MPATLERHQVALYLAALALGAAASFIPALAHLAGYLTLPALSLLLLATFLSIPLTRTTGEHPNTPAPGFRRTLLTLNFLLVPLIVAALIALVKLLAPGTPDALLFTAALVLLSPCIDYVVVFTRLSGGNSTRLLASTPLILGTQVLLVPLWLWIYRIAGLWDTAPITGLQGASGGVLTALAAIALPFLIALALQQHPRTRHTAQNAADATMIPLMLLVLGATTTAHTAEVTHHLTHLLPLAALYALYAATTWWSTHRLLGTTAHITADRTALTYSAVTRNALVILPIILATATTQNGALTHLLPLAVITQTIIELLTMTTMVAHYRKTHT